MICGGTKTVEATDNFGNTYRGCAVCRLLTEAEIAALLQGTAVPPDPRGTDGGPVRR
jgi:hypothetical protein